MNTPTVNPEFRLHYHAMPPFGWINDPNGFSRYKHSYHLFAQYHPYGTQWGPMHWGHWQSDDLVRWDWQNIVLSPDHPYDHAGCFSGTALEDGERLLLMYTGVSKNEDGDFQNQCIAEMQDDLPARKWIENPVLSGAALPYGASPHDFRDPKLLKTRDGYVAILATKGPSGGQLLSFSSKDLKTWHYEDVFCVGLGDMPECPDFFEQNGCAALICCVMNMPQEGLLYPNAQPAVYLLGEANEAKTRFTGGKPVALDFGLDFYAPQTVEAADGRRVMIGWMCCWGHVSPTHYLGHGWCGAMTLARELIIEGDRIRQRPVREIEAYRAEMCCLPSLRLSPSHPMDFQSHASAEIHLSFTDISATRIEVQLMRHEDEYFSITYDTATEVLRVDRSRCGYTMGESGQPESKPESAAAVPLAHCALDLCVFVDTCSVELFVNDGEAVLTSLAFPKHHGTGCRLLVVGGEATASVQHWALTTGETVQGECR